MDKWVSDDSVFISRNLGSADGVAQVYKLLSADMPLGEDSFSFIDETAGPSTIAPLVQWQRKDYLRLLDFLQANSLMVNASGHVILKSATKSRILGRPDGPTTYWRCLDILPMQVYRLLKPRDMGIKPKFLIVGGDVDQLSNTTEITGDVAEVGEWKVKYENLDAAYNNLKLELEELKVRLALADNTLIVCQDENKNLESANEQFQNILNATEAERQKAIEENEQLQIRVDEIQVERKKATEELEKVKAENSNLQDLKARLDAADKSLIACEGAKKKLASEVEKLKSSNEQLKIEVNKTEVLRKKASEERDKLTAEITNLQGQLGNSVPNSVMEEEKKALILSSAEYFLRFSYYTASHFSEVFVRMDKLTKNFDRGVLKEVGMKKIRIHMTGVYSNGTRIYAMTAESYIDDGTYLWNKLFFHGTHKDGSPRLLFCK